MLAIGRMCTLSDNLHGKLAQPELLAETVKTVSTAASPTLLKASLYLLQSSVQTSAEAARLAVDAGALPSLCERLEDSDAGTKAAAAWCRSGLRETLRTSMTAARVAPLKAQTAPPHPGAPPRPPQQPWEAPHHAARLKAPSK